MLPPTPISAVRESRTAKNRNPKTQESEAHAPLSCKIHYSITRAYPRKLDAPEFFTDDELRASHKIFFGAPDPVGENEAKLDLNTKAIRETIGFHRDLPGFELLHPQRSQ